MNKEEQETRYEKWRNLIKEQELSGIPQGEFCKGRGISSAQMSYYRSIFKPKGTVANKYFLPKNIANIFLTSYAANPNKLRTKLFCFITSFPT